MNLIEGLHERFNVPRRARILASRISELIPRDAHVLDVGTGDGQIAALIELRRPDVRICGIDLLVRERTEISVTPFDGRRIPFPDDSFDVVTFVDVLHHAADPMQLLREALRVSRNGLIVKDHTCDGFLAHATLRFMDRVGNRRFGIPVPADYWSAEVWRAAFAELELQASVWDHRLELYPWPLGLVFDRSLHCLCRLD
jgi:SAM-dependent methyltransferase